MLMRLGNNERIGMAMHLIKKQGKAREAGEQTHCDCYKGFSDFPHASDEYHLIYTIHGC
jgi:alpha-D-ribose 1-methylphosphonate 5-triphosphate synthase subunit PhnI